MKLVTLRYMNKEAVFLCEKEAIEFNIYDKNRPNVLPVDYYMFSCISDIQAEVAYNQLKILNDEDATILDNEVAIFLPSVSTPIGKTLGISMSITEA